MTVLEQLLAGSYEGAGFLIRSSNLTTGRKTVTHEYPNSGNRFVEDLGESQEIYTIEAIVAEPNYFTKRDALIAALKKEGQGQLVHPFYGDVTVTAKPFTLTEDLRSLNIATFTMTFEKSDENQFPTQSASKTSLINQIKTAAFGSTARDLIAKFSVGRSSPRNYIDALTTLSNLTGALSINSDTVVRVVNEISSFNSLLNTFQDHETTNVYDSEQLSTDFTNVFNSYGQLGSTPENQLALTKRLFDFGADRAPIMPTTTQRIERLQNRNIINSVVRANALIQAYNTVPEFTFTNTDQIDEVSQTLDAQYDYLLSDNILEGDTIAEIKDMRVEVREYLDQQRALAPKIATITTHEIPMSILAFNYYGNTDDVQELIDLNSTIDVTFVKGDVRILTE